MGDININRATVSDIICCIIVLLYAHNAKLQRFRGKDDFVTPFLCRFTKYIRFAIGNKSVDCCALLRREALFTRYFYEAARRNSELQIFLYDAIKSSRRFGQQIESATYWQTCCSELHIFYYRVSQRLKKRIRRARYRRQSSICCYSGRRVLLAEYEPP